MSLFSMAKVGAGNSKRADQRTGAGGLAWRIESGGGGTIVQLVGEIDETFALSPLKIPAGPVVLDIAGIRRITSAGIREWLCFIRNLASTRLVTLTRCSFAFVMQLNMIYNFRGSARVQSILVPYSCPSCLRCVDRLLDVDALRDHQSLDAHAMSCEACGTVMEFDELPERYLSFLDFE